MERLRRLSRFWSWLPAFRAVAECSHLPTAASEFLITPSALSRAVRLLERDLGLQLFERTGRSLVLNDAGRQLLAATRESMRTIDEALLHLRQEHLVGPVHIGSVGAVTTALVVPALDRLRLDHPGLLPIVSSPDSAEIAGALRRGDLDIAFHGPLSDAAPHGLTTTSLGTVASRVYAGRGHPLFGRRRVPRETIVAAAFVCPPNDSAGRPLDGWPVDVPRQVAMMVDQMRVGVEICLRGALLAVLPDMLAQTHPLAEHLWPLPFEGLADAPLLATVRQKIGFQTRGDVVLATVQQVQRELHAVAKPPVAASRRPRQR